MQPPFDITPQYIIDEYNLTEISQNGNIFIKIQKGLYGIPKYRRIAHDIFKKTGETQIPTCLKNPGTLDPKIHIHIRYPHC